MRQIPLCRKCDHHHWNVQPCVTMSRDPEVGDIVREDDGRKIEVITRPREGFRDVATRLDTLVPVGGNTFGQKRKPLHEEIV